LAHIKKILESTGIHIRIRIRIWKQVLTGNAGYNYCVQIKVNIISKKVSMKP